jgi:hypothetical protein
MRTALLPWSTALCLGLLASAGCVSPDPEASLLAFIEATDTGPIAADLGPGTDADTGGTSGCLTGDFSGIYLLSLVVGTLDPGGDTPLNIELTVSPDPADASLWRMAFQPIATDLQLPDREGPRVGPPAARDPVGDPIVLDGVQVSPAGAFTVGVTDIIVGDDANNITGREIQATLTLTGNFVADTIGCGTVDGRASRPLTINLRGSTFGFVRVDSVQGYTGDLIRSCSEPSIATACPDEPAPVAE